MHNLRTDDNRLHPRIVNDTHIAILQEPNSNYLGYLEASETDRSPVFPSKLLSFFSDKNIDLKNVVGIGCDGESKNTGRNNGIIRNIELILQRPLHWFICQLHFNELPFRHLFKKIDASVTTGPRSTTGKLAKTIEDVDKQVKNISNLNQKIKCQAGYIILTRFLPMYQAYLRTYIRTSDTWSLGSKK